MRTESIEARWSAWAAGHVNGGGTDSLESRMNALDARNESGQEALRRRLRSIRDEAARQHLPAMASAAERAHLAGTADLRREAAVVLLLLRMLARMEQEARAFAPGERDRDTGPATREDFARRFEQLSRIADRPAAVAALRMDNYATVLRRHGEQMAARILAHIGRILQGQLRQGDCLASFQAGEFLLLLPDRNEQGLHTLLSHLELLVQQHPFVLPGGQGREELTISAGGHPFQAGPDERPAGGPLRIGLIAHNGGTAQAAARLLARHGCDVVTPGVKPVPFYAPFVQRRAQLVILECEACDLAIELGRLRAELVQERTPVLVLAASAAGARWALQHGASDAFAKPVNLDLVLRVAFRLASRGRRSLPSDGPAMPPPPVLVASEDLHQLLALGSSLQHQGGYAVRLGRGCADARAQMRRHDPAVLLLDLPEGRDDTRQLVGEFAARRPFRSVVLLGDRRNAAPDGAGWPPHVACFLQRPVALATLAGDLRRATDLEAPDHSLQADAILCEEILRLMKPASLSTRAA